MTLQMFLEFLMKKKEEEIARSSPSKLNRVKCVF
jgi:hypothetical protein